VNAFCYVMAMILPSCRNCVSVALLHAVFAAQEIQVFYEDTSRTCADVFNEGVFFLQQGSIVCCNLDRRVRGGVVSVVCFCTCACPFHFTCPCHLSFTLFEGRLCCEVVDCYLSHLGVFVQ
jgi:hypothetical protein